jgi:exosortase/archaeosortase family protein
MDNHRGKIVKSMSRFLTDPQYVKVRAIFLFIFITVVIHFAWRFWANRMHYFPVLEGMNSAVQFTTRILVSQTQWVLDHLHVHYRLQYPVFWFDAAWGLSINEGCSGFKQIAQFMLLILFFPGSWRNKIWFIPAGMILVYLTNLFRIVVLALALNFHLANVHAVHDYLLRSLFYVVIFLLWLLWINRLAGIKTSRDQKPA